MGGTSSSRPSSPAKALLSQKSGAGLSLSSAAKPPSYIRRAHHAGSWYESSPSGLEAELSAYLRDAEANGGGGGPSNGDRMGLTTGEARAVVSPHAGFRYSGPTAAYAYLALREALAATVVTEGDCRKKSGELTGSGDGAVEFVKRVTILVLHPSHHVRMDGCAVSGECAVVPMPT